MPVDKWQGAIENLSGETTGIVWTLFGLEVVTGPPQEQKNALPFCSRRGTEKNVFYCSGARQPKVQAVPRGPRTKAEERERAARLQVVGAGRLI